jgi:predicted RNase H-like HicB family nuclease
MQMKAIVAVEQDAAGGWYAQALNLPGCIVWADTEAEALARIDEAVNEWLGLAGEYLLPRSQG